jgi:hypothetical protein
MDNGKTSKNISLKRVIIKGVLLFLLINFIFVALNPLPILGQVSAYNWIFPGRVRLPFGEKPDQAYNLSLYNLDAMFASQELSAGDKPKNEYRVLLLGDSSVWGFLLKPENTLAGFINSAEIQLPDNRNVRAYNLGYPTMSLTKDLMILNYALRYKPDLIIWLTTLESFPKEKQLESPIVQNNAETVRNLINTYSLKLKLNDTKLITRSFLDSTLIGQRRAIADILRLQLFGVPWAATGIDQYYPPTYEPPQNNLENDDTFQGLKPPELNPNDLSMDVLSAGSDMSRDIPMIIVNEPIFISDGENSDIRYNFFYPRWAYDQYRTILADYCLQKAWQCLDVWNLVPSDDFTNSAIHMTPRGTQLLASKLRDAIISLNQP